MDGFEPIAQRDMEAAFDERFEALRPRLLSICIGLVGPADAHDVVQDTYLRARGRLFQLRDDETLEGWLARIAVSLCYNRHRRSRLLRDRLPLLALRHQPNPASDLGLRELIEQLPGRERTVLILHHGYGYGLDEIAELLSLTHTNVRTIIARTRKRLAAQWQEADS